MTILMRRTALVIASCMTIFCSPAAQAAYPDHSVRLLVGYAPGGSTDVVARFIAQKLSEKWGQPVLVENRAGADGTIANEVESKAAPDGYTLLMATADFTRSPALHKLTYDPVKDFTPIILASSSGATTIVVSSSSPIKSVKELISIAKADPGKLNLATGKGSAPDPAMDRFMRETGAKMTVIPFSGTAPTLVALLGGEVQVVSASVSSVVEQVKAGKLRALAVTSDVRAPLMPDVPTVAEEANLPGFNEIGTWHGFMGPANLPGDIVAKIHDDVASIVKSPTTNSLLVNQGFIIYGDTPEQFRKYIGDELVKWAAPTAR